MSSTFASPVREKQVFFMSFSVTLCVSCLNRTESFYREVLHLSILRHQLQRGMPEILILNHGSGTILFREKVALQSQHPALFAPLDRHPWGLGCSIEFEVADLEHVRREFARRQQPLLYELSDEEFGWEELWVHDPDGYLIILSQGPSETDPRAK
jgi:catechol 2,3-dioxygenase-like lactoylglutathione lyase family enzyme